MLTIQSLTPKTFQPYGWIIGYPKKHLKGTKRNLWRIVLTETQKTGWRIAYLVLRDKRIKRLECHPNTFESFEPVVGKSLIYVATKKDPKSIQCFELTHPIILKKGIWHGVVTLTPETEIKITENAKVKCVYWQLGKVLTGIF